MNSFDDLLGQRLVAKSYLKADNVVHASPGVVGRESTRVAGATRKLDGVGRAEVCDDGSAL